MNESARARAVTRRGGMADEGLVMSHDSRKRRHPTELVAFRRVMTHHESPFPRAVGERRFDSMATRVTPRPTPPRASRAMTRERRPGGEHTRKRAVFRELGNGPYRRRESFDADAMARDMARMRAEMKNDDDGGRVALTRERERMEKRESEVRASTRREETREDDVR